MAYDVETRPATFAAARARTLTRRSLALVAAFVGVGAVPLVLTQAFEVPLVASAMIVTLMVALYHAADGQSALMERWLKGSAAEAAVGETLETLRWERYIVMHDVPQRVRGTSTIWSAGRTGSTSSRRSSRATSRCTSARRSGRRRGCTTSSTSG